MDPKMYFEAVRRTDDDHVLYIVEQSDGERIRRDVRTVDVGSVGGIVGAIKAHWRGEWKAGNSMIEKGNVSRFAILDIDAKRKDGDSWIPDPELSNKLWSVLEQRMDGIVGRSYAAFRTVSGGAHVYILLSSPIQVVDAFSFSSKISTLFSEFHVDVYPTPGRRRIAWEYYAGQDNLVIRPERSMTPDDVRAVSMALSGRPRDLSRSGHDFRFAMRGGLSEILVRIFRELPWNEGRAREITPDYVRRTLEKAGIDVSALEGLQLIPASSIRPWVPTVRMYVGPHRVYDRELVVVHGEPGVGKTTLVLKSVPQHSVYISSELDESVFKLFTSTHRPGEEFYFAFSTDPNSIITFMAQNPQFPAFIIDSFQHLTIENTIEGGRIVRFLREFASRTGTPVIVVSHDNRRDESGLGRIHTYSQLGQLATKVICVTRNGIVLQKDTFALLANSEGDANDGGFLWP